MKTCVGIISDNSESVVVQMLLSWRENKAVVMISKDAPTGVISDIILENSLSTCYCNEDMLFRYIDLFPNTNFLPFEKESFEEIRKNIDDFLFPKSEEIALVLYSSGTTGKAKGIMLSHRAINGNAEAVISYMNPRKEDSFFIIKNLLHSSTIVGEILVALKNENALLFAKEHSNLRKTMEEIFSSKATIMCLNPTILKLLLKFSDEVLREKLQYLRRIYVSGAILDKNILVEARERFDGTTVINVYGMTECGPRIASQELSEAIIGNSVGQPIEGVRIRLSDDQKEEILDSFHVGMVEVNTPYRANGYSNGQLFPIDNEGWISTKDIGYFDDKRNLYICGRADNMLNVAGYNVFPETVEEIIKRLDGIEECMVDGEENSITGTKLVCFYKGNKVNKQKVYDFCKHHLLPHEIPQKYVEVNKFTYVNGKIKRKQFKEIGVD